MLRAISPLPLNQAAVSITGGSIDGAPIGGSIPAAVSGTIVAAGSYVAGGASGVNASVVIPGVATLTVSKGIITAVV